MCHVTYFRAMRMCVGATGRIGKMGATGATGASGSAEPVDPDVAANCSGQIGKLRCITFFVHCPPT